ncbi:hypothetical protein ANN_09686 [Periplaneta americana]|uniref:CRAL-TRIO domain-containing protein n=1 Tax=Periplaneta americana TaxID=6978 RepID=A0ABQ8TPZ5_PERAM|nr:hypothetical protein ANN_09686 [Periplaneta americana]
MLKMLRNATFQATFFPRDIKGGYPAKLKKVLIVTAPLWFKAPFKILRLFVREKLRDRVFTVSIPQGGYPAKLKKVLIVTAPLWFKAPFKILRLFVREKLRDRVFTVSIPQFLVQQHITTSKHQANKQLNSKQRQLFLTQPTTSNVRSEFNIDLCRSLISADIPLYKLKNKVFREFLEKYTQHTIPDESTLRKTYAPSIYDETIQKIRDEIKDSSIWVSIDETPDKEGRLVGNVVIGLLSEQYSERILLHCDVLEKCNNKTIVKLFNEAMGILWPKGIMYDNVLFFISDAAPYMVKAGQALSVVYPKLTHFTCVAHAFHRVAEVVRDNFLK